MWTVQEGICMVVPIMATRVTDMPYFTHDCTNLTPIPYLQMNRYANNIYPF